MIKNIINKMIFALLGIILCGTAFAQSTVLSGGVSLAQQPGDVRSAAQFARDCAAGVGLSNCVTPSTPRNCQSGTHWTTAGSGVAHCVSDDPPCAYPSHLEHDYLGNPSCVPPVITTGYEYQTLPCSSAYVGTGEEQRRDVTYYDGVPAAYGGWQTTAFNCTLKPPPAALRPPPFQGADLNTQPLGYSSTGPATVGVTYATDGTWAAFGSPKLGQSTFAGKKPNNGRWNSDGRDASEFEIYWTAKVIEEGLVATSNLGDEPNVFTVSSPEAQWTSLTAGWKVSYTDYPFACSYPYDTYVYVRIRLKSDPSQEISGLLLLSASGYGGHCYG